MRLRIGPQRDDELADGRPGEARVEEAEQEDDRREPDHGQRRPLQRLEPRALEVPVHEERRDQDEADREQVDQERQRTPAMPACTPPPSREDADPDDADRTQREKLDVLRRRREGGPRGNLQQASRAKGAERQLHQLEADRARVRGADEHALESGPQPALGEGEKDVQEERGGQDVEGGSDRVEHVHVRQLKSREAAGDAARDHQQPQAAFRPAPPCDQAGEDVRDGDPVQQARLHEIDIVARQGKRDRAGGRGAARGGDRGDEPQLRLARENSPVGCFDCRGQGHSGSVLNRELRRRNPSGTTADWGTRTRMKGCARDHDSAAQPRKRAAGRDRQSPATAAAKPPETRPPARR